jgi:acetyl esterase/lipase
MTATTACAQTPSTMRWPDLLERPRPSGAITIPYGTDPLQVGDLWLPADTATITQTIPVVLMVHGGCWQTDIADRSIMDWIAADLASQGIAVWNIDYRGVDRPGGGYPGTFADVAAAADHLRTIAPQYRLDASRVVAFGHSAGGHLALWLAGRSRLPATSALADGDPLPIHAVIASGALPDIEAALALDNNQCTTSAMPALTGTATPERPDPLADTSIPNLLPLGVRQIFVNAAADSIAPPSLATGYAAKAYAVGESVDVVTISNEGHVELIAPGTRAWAAELAAIRAELARAGTSAN